MLRAPAVPLGGRRAGPSPVGVIGPGAASGLAATPPRRPGILEAAASPARSPAAAHTRRPVGAPGPDRFEQLGIDVVGGDASVGARLGDAVDEEVEEVTPDDHVLPQRHRAVLLDDDLGRPADLPEPGPELLGIAHRRRERDDEHVLREVDDDLFPHRAAEAVGEVVHLVHDHVAEPRERARLPVHHVAQHLGRHDDDRGLGVDRRVAGEEADGGRTVAAHEVGVLLVAQRLDRRRVEGLAARREREVDGELTHDRLARPGRCGDEDPTALLEGGSRAPLEVVELEVEAGGELRELRVAGAVGGLAPTRPGESLCGARHGPTLRHGPRDQSGLASSSPRSAHAGRSLARRRSMSQATP